MQKIYLIILVSIFALSALTGFYAKQNMSILKKKKEAQEKNIESFKRWKSAYKALVPYQKKWDSIYKDVSKVNDILSLYRMMHLETSGIFVDPERLVVESVNRVTFNESDVGLNQICVSSAGSAGLRVTSNNFANLIRGVEKIASRKDVRMESMTLSKKHKRPIAILEDFCVYLRESYRNDNRS